MSEQPKTIFLNACAGLALLPCLSLHFSADSRVVGSSRAKSRNAPLSHSGDRTRKRPMARVIIFPVDGYGLQDWNSDAGP